MNPTLRRVCLGIAGYLAFFTLFLLHDRSSDWDLELGRNAAVHRAIELARAMGIETSGWRWAVTAEDDKTASDWVWTHPEDPLRPYIDPVRLGVWLRSPRGPERLRIWMSPGGELREFQQRIEEGEGAGLPSDEQALKLASAAMQRLVPDPSPFSLLPDQPQRDGNELKFVWELADPDESVRPRVVVELRDGKLGRAILEPGFSEAFRRQVDSRRDLVEALTVISVFVVIGFVLLGLVFYVSGSFRKLVDQRSVLTLIGVAGLLHLVATVAGGPWDAQNMEDDLLLEALLGALLLIGGVIAPCIAGLWGGSFTLTPSRLVEKNVTTELLIGRGPRVKAVGSSLLFGWAAAGFVAALPYLIAVAGMGLNAVVTPLHPGSLVSSVPLLPALDWFAQSTLLFWTVAFAAGYPLLNRLIPRGRVRTVLQWLLTSALLSVPFMEAPLTAAAVNGAVVGGLSIWIYRRGDLLSILMLSPAWVLARHSAAHLSQPATEIFGWGVVMLVALSLPLPVAVWIIRRGEDVDLDHEVQKRQIQALRLENLRKAERDRLLAEFSVARRAQQQMLPDVPPQLDGLQLATICEPAREVGGDFYDLIPLGPDQWGIVVADVSGKGVPAALYMTFTKGLLQSLGETGSPPASIVVELNRFLHSVARRRVFVTMALGALDLKSKVVQCFRAGHNPPVWRRATRGESEIIRPSGLGLGLTSRGLFERSLAHQEVALEPGDALFFYSDGIPEAMNREGEEYGEQRLLQAIARTDGLSARQARDLILADVKAFLAGHPPNDDITLVVVRAVAGGQEPRLESLSKQRARPLQ